MKQQVIAQKLPKIKPLIELQTYLQLGCLKTQDSGSSREQSLDCSEVTHGWGRQGHDA